jgi:hypothetical protein
MKKRTTRVALKDAIAIATTFPSGPRSTKGGGRRQGASSRAA